MDKGLYNQFLMARDDLDKQLREIMSVTDSERAGDLLIRIKQLQERYQSLFDEMVFLNIISLPRIAAFQYSSLILTNIPGFALCRGVLKNRYGRISLFLYQLPDGRTDDSGT